MGAQNLDSEIIIKVKSLSSYQKNQVLNYLDLMPREIHSRKLHKRKALKQIKSALQSLELRP